MQFARSRAPARVVIPAHLNELSRAGRGPILPDFAYQLGNTLSSRSRSSSRPHADRHNGGSLNVTLSATVVLVAITVAIGRLRARGKGARSGR